MPTKKALKERGIDSMLDEARADNKENDAEYLKPSIRSSCMYVFRNIRKIANSAQKLLHE